MLSESDSFSYLVIDINTDYVIIFFAQSLFNSRSLFQIPSLPAIRLLKKNLTIMKHFLKSIPDRLIARMQNMAMI